MWKFIFFLVLISLVSVVCCLALFLIIITCIHLFRWLACITGMCKCIPSLEYILRKKNTEENTKI